MKITPVDEEFKALQILHRAFWLGAAMILLINHFFIHPIGLGRLSDVDGLVSAGIAAGIMGLILSNFLFNKQTEKLGRRWTAENSTSFRQAYIIRMALLESPLLINAILYFYVTQHSLHIIMAIILLLLLISSGPVKEYYHQQ